MTLAFTDIVTVPKWRMESPALAASAAGFALAWDNRNSDVSGNPYIFGLRSASALDIMDPTTGEWLPLSSPGLTGTFGAGATAVMHPSQGPRGLLAAGGTTLKIILATALPAAVGINQLANRGDGVGFRIAILNKVTGKMEFRAIVANTAGTTPTIWLDAALSAAPNLNDGYEIRSGRVYMLSAGTLAAGCWKYFDVATNSYSGNLGTTNLPATIGTDSNAVALSESYVPIDRKPNEGFIVGGATYDTATGAISKNCIQATAAGATSLTGSGMPADLQSNEYRNFQVRIVEDTVTPAAVGQRSRITSHTGGATGVFTVAAFTVTPSASAKFVVENDDDKILLRSSATTSVYTHNITANTWDVTTFAVAGAACGAGVVFEQAFGTVRDVTNNHRHSFIYCVRGGASAAIDVLDIAGAAAGSWSSDIAYSNKSQTFTTGTCGAYAPATFGGRFMHLNVNGTQRMARFDVQNRRLDAGTYLRFPQGTPLVGQKVAISTSIKGAEKIDCLYHLTNSQVQCVSMLVSR
jgi:hypothetical protein